MTPRQAKTVAKRDVTFEHTIQVAHALDMVIDLRRFTHDATLNRTVQAGCRESFWINVRALCEFFLSRFSENIHWTDYLTEFDPASGDRLRPDWGWASKHVAHFSFARQGTETVVDDPLDRFTNVASDLLAVFVEFSDALEAAEHPDALFFERHTADALARL
jgi:hypothetical protein